MKIEHIPVSIRKEVARRASIDFLVADRVINALQDIDRDSREAERHRVLAANARSKLSAEEESALRDQILERGQ
ncbi:MAG: hypothetical protein AAF989_10505 [Planctomycetota bacterium]